ncbi:MAG: SLC13 family permease [Actinomycetota bacterium]|nr:SLC13 family permease [Actinomycetota bacterium]
MSWEAWFTLALVVVAVAVLMRDLLAPSATIFGATVVLLLIGVITPEQALSGFANPAPFTVAALYILARGVEKTGALQPIITTTLGEGSSRHGSLARLLVPTSAASAFLNNTPIVAMLTPQVTDWADRRGRSASHYLMPMSFATILGGVLTLIGTSTNLVVSGLLQAAGRPPIGMFELIPVGLPVAVLGLAVVIVLAPRVLPARRSARLDLEEDFRQFVLDMVVVDDGPLDGRTVEGGGLRHLQGVYLVQIERNGELLAPATPETVLRGGDRLRFVGKSDLVVDLQTSRGLRSAEQSHLAGFDTRRAAFFEAVVGAASPLVGRTLREVEFRSRYQAAVLAIHRAGQRVDAQLGQVPLRVGDTLLLLSDSRFRERWYDRNDFLLVSRLGAAMPTSTRQAALVGVIGLGIVLLAATGILPILQASLLGAVALVLAGVLTPGEARNAVDLDVVVLIAASFGLAAAIESSGLADRLAQGLVDIFSAWGPRGVLLGVVLATVLLTELITNNAAAVLIFPIAASSAATLGIDPRGFAVALAVAASASFLTPIGYQTNTMVYGPGGYRFGDYARLGAPLTLMVIMAVVAFVPVFWPF